MNRLSEEIKCLRTRRLDGGWMGSAVVAEWADRATKLIVDTVIGKGCDSVLVPALYCAEVVDSIVEAGLSCAFYEIDKDLSGSASGLTALLRQGRPALLWLHPFGLIRPLPNALRHANAIIIHDCCHALQTVMHDPRLSLGGMNVSPDDVLIFSLRKGLARKSGGVRVRGADPARVTAGPPAADAQWNDHLNSSGLLSEALSRFLPKYGRGTILSHLPLLSDNRDADIAFLRAQGIPAWRWQREIKGKTATRTPIAVRVASKLLLVEVPRAPATALSSLPAILSRKLFSWEAL